MICMNDFLLFRILYIIRRHTYIIKKVFNFTTGYKSICLPRRIIIYGSYVNMLGVYVFSSKDGSNNFLSIIVKIQSL